MARGDALLVGSKQFPDPLEIRVVLRQVVTCGKTGSHEEDELGKGNSARDPGKAHNSKELTS